MIGGIARAQIAEVTRLVTRMIRRQRAQPVRRQQASTHDIEQWTPALADEDRIIQRNGQDLIGPACGIVFSTLVVTIDNVVEITTFGIPIAAVEKIPGFLRVGGNVIRLRCVTFFAQPSFEQA